MSQHHADLHCRPSPGTFVLLGVVGENLIGGLGGVEAVAARDPPKGFTPESTTSISLGRSLAPRWIPISWPITPGCSESALYGGCLTFP